MITFTIAEMHDILGYVSEPIQQGLRNNNIEPTIIKDDLPRYSKETVTLLMDAGYGHPRAKTLFSVPELAYMFNFYEMEVRAIISKNNLHPVWFRDCRDLLYDEELIEKLSEIKGEIGRTPIYYSVAEICDELGIMVEQIGADEVWPIWRKGMFISEESMYSEAQYRYLREKYLGEKADSKELLTMKEVARMYEVSRDTVSGIIRKEKILPRDRRGSTNLYGLELIRAMEKRGFIIGNKRQLLTTEDVSDFTGWSRKEIEKRRALYDVAPIYRSNLPYYTPQMMQQMQDENRKRITIRDYAKEKQIDEIAFRSFVASSDIKYVQFNGIPRFKKEDLEQVYVSESYKAFSISQNKELTDEQKLRGVNADPSHHSIADIINAGMDSIGDYGKAETKILLRDYLLSIVNKINRQKDPRAYIKDRLNLSLRLLKDLPKEINRMEAYEIEQLMGDNKVERYLWFIRSFVEYLNKHAGMNINVTVTVRRTRGKKSSAKEVYSKDEWGELQEFLIDVDKHFDKAIDDDDYCQHWLFMLLHLYCFMRASDLQRFPVPKDYLITKKEDVTPGLAVRICDNAAKQLETMKTEKTSAELFPATPPEFLSIPVATALIICNMHRKKSGRDQLFEEGYAKKYRRYIDRFFDGTELSGFVFKNKKANSSLITHCRTKAMEEGKSAFVPYDLMSDARSHQKKPGKMAVSTSEYIAATVGDYNLEECMLTITNRGAFGWVYETLFYVLKGGERKNYSPDEITRGINALKTALSPIELESLTGNLLLMKDDQNKLIEKYESLTRPELEQIANDIANEKRVCITPGVYCTNPSECPHKTALGGVGCKYAMMTVHAVKVLSELTKEHIDKLNRSTNKNMTDLEIKTVMEYLRIGMEFIESFRENGLDYIEYYLDLKGIQERLERSKLASKRRNLLDGKNSNHIEGEI